MPKTTKVGALALLYKAFATPAGLWSNLPMPTNIWVFYLAETFRLRIFLRPLRRKRWSVLARSALQSASWIHKGVLLPSTFLLRQFSPTCSNSTLCRRRFCGHIAASCIVRSLRLLVRLDPTLNYVLLLNL